MLTDSPRRRLNDREECRAKPVETRIAFSVTQPLESDLMELRSPSVPAPQRSPPRRGAVQSALRFNALLAAVVWLAWGIFGRAPAWHSLVTYWRVALTMVFGSLVGGGTSEGGAAIAFPVFTKLLHIPPGDARLFSFAIQTVGMGGASLSILYQKIPIESRVLAWAGGSGVVGMIASTYLLVPNVPGPIVRVAFTAMVTSLAIVLLLTDRNTRSVRHDRMPVFGSREKLIVSVAGCIGGMLSGLIGCGENIVIFMVLVVLFRVNEKVVTPTTVLLMTMVTSAAFALHLFVLRDFPGRVIHYWLAAVPIAIVAAPLGAFLCSRIERHTIVAVLVSLIAIELLSTLLLVDLRHGAGLTGAAALVIFGAMNLAMIRSNAYRMTNRLTP